MTTPFQGYISADKDFLGTRLNANEGVKGRYNLYPPKRDKHVIDIFCRLYDVSSEMLLMDRGIDGALEVLFNGLIEKNDRVLSMLPTYGMYSILSQISGAEYLEVSYDKILSQIDRLSPKLLIICRPNNPDGRLLSLDDINKMIETLPPTSYIAIDEAYIEFEEENSLKSLCIDYENVIILRTLSKAYSLASLRVGFAIANEKLIQKLIPYQAPYPISGLVLDYIKKNFTSDYISEINVEIERVKSWKKRLQKYFSSTGGNFLYCKNKNAYDFYRKFKDENILIRYFKDQNAFRISIGTDDQMQQVEALCEKWL